MTPSAARRKPPNSQSIASDEPRCENWPLHNYTRVHNQLFELIGVVSASTMEFLLLLHRETVGWNRDWTVNDKGETTFKLPTLAARLDLDDRQISRILKQVVDSEEAVGIVKARKSSRNGHLREFRLLPENYAAFKARVKQEKTLREAKRPVENDRVTETSTTFLSEKSPLRIESNGNGKRTTARVRCPIGLPCPHPEGSTSTTLMSEKFVHVNGSANGDAPPFSTTKMSEKCSELADSTQTHPAEIRETLRGGKLHGKLATLPHESHPIWQQTAAKLGGASPEQLLAKTEAVYEKIRSWQALPALAAECESSKEGWSPPGMKAERSAKTMRMMGRLLAVRRRGVEDA